MRGSSPEEKPDDNQLSTEQIVSAETGTQEQAVGLADVVAVQRVRRLLTIQETPTVDS